jgi:hypothetical protein
MAGKGQIMISSDATDRWKTNMIFQLRNTLKNTINLNILTENVTAVSHPLMLGFTVDTNLHVHYYTRTL